MALNGTEQTDGKREAKRCPRDWAAQLARVGTASFTDMQWVNAVITSTSCARCPAPPPACTQLPPHLEQTIARTRAWSTLIKHQQGVGLGAEDCYAGVPASGCACATLCCSQKARHSGEARYCCLKASRSSCRSPCRRHSSSSLGQMTWDGAQRSGRVGRQGAAAALPSSR